MHSIDIAPNFTVTGVVLAEGGALPEDLEARLHERLAQGRFIAAVNHDPARAPEDDVFFSLACDADLRILRAGKTGKIIVGKLLENFEAELQRELGFTVSLTQDLGADADFDDAFDLDFDDGFDDEADEEFFDDGLDAWVAPAEAGFDDAVHELAGHELTEFPDTLPVWEDLEPPERVLVFSRRGVSNAALLAWLAKSSVEAGQAGNWSAYRYLDSDYVEIPAAGAGELPSIEVRFADDKPDGWASVAVSTRDAQGLLAHTVYPSVVAHRRPVIDASALNEQAAQLLAVVTNANLDHHSDVNYLIADESLDVDADALHAALAPEFEGRTADRVQAVVTALGVPEELASAAVQGDRMPEQQRFEGRRFWRNMVQLAEQGVAGIRPLGRAPTRLEAAADEIRKRPVLGVTIATAEAALGTWLLSAGARARGARRGLGLIGGVLLVSDAILDLIIIARRRR